MQTGWETMSNAERCRPSSPSVTPVQGDGNNLSPTYLTSASHPRCARTLQSSSICPWPMAQPVTLRMRQLRELKPGQQPGSGWAEGTAHHQFCFYTSIHAEFTKMNALSPTSFCEVSDDKSHIIEEKQIFSQFLPSPWCLTGDVLQPSLQGNPATVAPREAADVSHTHHTTLIWRLSHKIQGTPWKMSPKASGTSPSSHEFLIQKIWLPALVFQT